MYGWLFAFSLAFAGNAAKSFGNFKHMFSS